MPSRGAVLVTNGRARRKKSVDLSRLVKRLKNRRPSRKARARKKNSWKSRKHTFRARRRNGIAFRANSHKRWGKKRRNSKRSKHSKRRNPLAFRRNGIAMRRNSSMSGGVFAKVSAFLKKLPGGKIVAPIAVPAAAGALIVAGVHYGLAIGVPYIPTVVAPYVAPIGYTLGAAVLGLLVQFVPTSILSKQSKQAIAGLAIVGGGAVDGIRYLTASSAPEASATAGFGEGGYWQMGSRGNARSGCDADEMTVRQAYSDASLADAKSAPVDFSAAEGEAILSGPRTWASRFPPVRHITQSLNDSVPSRHAGKHGDRWGWLFKNHSFSEVQDIARKPLPLRVATLAKLKAEASAGAKLPQMSYGRYGALVFAQ